MHTVKGNMSTAISTKVQSLTSVSNAGSAIGSNAAGAARITTDSAAKPQLATNRPQHDVLAADIASFAIQLASSMNMFPSTEAETVLLRAKAVAPDVAAVAKTPANDTGTAGAESEIAVRFKAHPKKEGGFGLIPDFAASSARLTSYYIQRSAVGDELNIILSEQTSLMEQCQREHSWHAAASSTNHQVKRASTYSIQGLP